jgi:dual specificity phosphatase 3
MTHTFKHANADFITDFLVVGGDLDPDNHLGVKQALELVDAAAVTHVLDVRLEMDDSELWAHLPEVAYRWDGMDDAGQTVPDDWWDGVTEWAVDAITAGGRVLVHCHMGINRSPSVAFAILLTLGWDPVDALTAIRSARPIANAWYAEQALTWHLKRTQALMPAAALAHRRVAAWRSEHPLDVIRVIADIRTRQHDW